jgi:hypothetical protein
LKQPPIQFPPCPEPPIQNLYNNTSYSHVGDEGNDIEVHMDDFLQDTQAKEGMLLDAFQQNELGDETNVVDTFFKTLKFSSIAPLFGRLQGSRSTQLETTLLL